MRCDARICHGAVGGLDFFNGLRDHKPVDIGSSGQNGGLVLSVRWSSRLQNNRAPRIDDMIDMLVGWIYHLLDLGLKSVYHQIAAVEHVLVCESFENLEQVFQKPRSV